MFYLLELREKIKEIYSGNKEYCRLLFKFLMSFITFFVISIELDFGTGFLNILAVLMLAVVGAFIPSAATVLLAGIVSVVCVFQYSIVIALIVFLILLIIYCLFLRFTPKLGYAMLAVPIAFALNMPCLIPIVMGLTVTPVAAVPVACGTVIYYLFKAIKSVENVSNSVSKVEAMQVFVYVMRKFTGNKALFFSTIVFIIITIIVYIIRTRNISHASEIAIIFAGVFNLMTFLFGNLSLDTGISVVSLIFGTIGACAIAYIIQFFKCVLDYTSVENVQFEDDDYVYFVKAVPKVKVSTQKNDVKKINEKKPVASENDESDEDGFEDDFDFDSIGKKLEKNMGLDEFDIEDTLTGLDLSDLDLDDTKNIKKND